MFTLYATPLSANARKVLAVSLHLGLDPEVKLVNVYKGEGRTPDYLAVNPSGKIPTLVDGDLTLWESNAILLYIAEMYGDYKLWSHIPKERSDISRWLFWEASQWQPALVHVLSGFVAYKLGLSNAATIPSVNWDDESFTKLAVHLDNHLQHRQFLTGDAITLADFSVAAMLMYVRDTCFPSETYANIASWYSRIENLEAWKATSVEPWL